jgi:ferritin-like metal-binding protein YciE
LLERIRAAEVRIEKIASDQAVAANNTQNLKEALQHHATETKLDLKNIYEKVNGIDRDQAAQLENQKTNTQTLALINQKLDTIRDDRAAIVSFPRIMAWFAGIAASLAAIYGYLKTINGGG